MTIIRRFDSIVDIAAIIWYIVPMRHMIAAIVMCMAIGCGGEWSDSVCSISDSVSERGHCSMTVSCPWADYSYDVVNIANSWRHSCDDTDGHSVSWHEPAKGCERHGEAMIKDIREYCQWGKHMPYMGD